ESIRDACAIFRNVFDLELDRVSDLWQLLIDSRTIDESDDVGGEVEHLLERARSDVEYQRQRAGNSLEVPDVADGRGKLNVTHALAPHFGAGDFDTAA